MTYRRDCDNLRAAQKLHDHDTLSIKNAPKENTYKGATDQVDVHDKALRDDKKIGNNPQRRFSHVRTILTRNEAADKFLESRIDEKSLTRIVKNFAGRNYTDDLLMKVRSICVSFVAEYYGGYSKYEINESRNRLYFAEKHLFQATCFLRNLKAFDVYELVSHFAARTDDQNSRENVLLMMMGEFVDISRISKDDRFLFLIEDYLNGFDRVNENCRPSKYEIVPVWALCIIDIYRRAIRDVRRKMRIDHGPLRSRELAAIYDSVNELCILFRGIRNKFGPDRLNDLSIELLTPLLPDDERAKASFKGAAKEAVGRSIKKRNLDKDNAASSE